MPRKCVVCSKEFTSRQHLSRHKKTHEAARRTFDCQRCDAQLSRPEYLTRHMKRRHQDEQTESSGEGEPAEKTARLVDYSDSESEPDSQQQNQQGSDESQETVSEPKQDDDERPFKCAVCSNGFRTRKAYGQHLNDVHTANVRLQCPHCEHHYANHGALQRHKDNAHAENAPSRSPLPGPSDEPHFDSSWQAEEHFEMRAAAHHRSKRFGTTVTDYEMRVTDLDAGNLEEAYFKLLDVLRRGMERMKNHSQKESYGRFVLQTEGLDYPISTAYDAVDRLTAERLVETVITCLNSQQTVDLNGLLKINFLHTEMPIGGGGNRANARNRSQPKFQDWAKNKRGIFDVASTAKDNLCLARVLCVAKYYEDNVADKQSLTHVETRLWDQLRRNRGGKQTAAAKELHRCSGLTGDGPFTVLAAQQYQKALGQRFKVVIFVDADKEPACVEGAVDAVPLFVYLNTQCEHFYYIRNMNAFLNVRFYCPKCHFHTQHPDRAPHKCEESGCTLCQISCCKNTLTKKDLVNQRAEHICQSCNRPLLTEDCSEAHRIEQCKKFVFCNSCQKLVERNKAAPEAHACLRPWCVPCKDFKPPGHLCFVQSPTERSIKRRSLQSLTTDDEETDYEPNASSDYYVADFESEIEPEQSHVHNPCMLIFKPMRADAPPHTVLKGENCHVDFIEMLMNDETFHNSTFIFHGLGNYDGFILLNAIHKVQAGVEVIDRSGRIMQIKLTGSKVRFIDSLTFCSMPLSRLPSTFGFPDLAKGLFPYKFAQKANRGYRGKLPALDYYDPTSKYGSAYEAIVSWHAEETLKYEADPNLVWSIEEEMEKYCKMDVDILSEACLRFQAGMAELFENLDVFKAMTLPSFCNYAFRALHMKTDSLAVLPPRGYKGRSNASKESLAWLEYEQKRSGVKIRHAHNGGEVKVGRYYLDGYREFTDEDGAVKKQAWEYQGCIWHGCACQPRDKVNFVNGKTMQQLDEETQEKVLFLQDQGFDVITLYSCEFRQLRQCVDELDEIYVYLENVWSPLIPRDSLRGGRTNVIRLKVQADISKGQRIRYLDFTSMYPSVMLCTDGEWWPVGHPDVYLHSFPDLDVMFGLIKAVLLPPKRLYFPVLPAKLNGKVRFVLCGKCGADNNCLSFCGHNDDERQIRGTFCTPEIQKAVEMGYKIVSIQELWHWPKERRSQDLFKSFLLTALREKQEASGWMPGCDTPEQRQAYVDDYLERQGVQLRIDHIEKNSGRRAIGKSVITTLWGYFGKNNCNVDTRYLKSRAELLKIISEGTHTIESVYMPNTNMLVARVKPLAEFEQPDAKGNVVIASLTTCYGRLKLYRLLSQLNERVVYFDTDSVIYTTDPGQPELETNPYMGSLTDEILGDFGEHAEISAFQGAGSKFYSFKVVDRRDGSLIKEKLTTKGFKMNQRTAPHITPQALDSAIQQGTRHSVTDCYIRRDLKTATIKSVEQTKTFRATADKRILMRDFSSLPIGWVGSADETAQIMPQRDIVDVL